MKSTQGVNAVILAGLLIALVGFGASSAFGVFLAPMSNDLGWGREIFSTSVAVQLLVMGLTQPIAGMVADRHGTGRVLAFGAVVGGLGFLLRGIVNDPALFVATGVLVGVGTGAATFPIVMGALGKIVSAERRSFVFGLGTAAASLGMFITPQLATSLIERIGWSPTLIGIGAAFAIMLPCAYVIARVPGSASPTKGPDGFAAAIRTAFQDRSYVCLFFGFFVCGFHVAFISTHLPAYLGDLGLPAHVGAWSLSLIGLFNIAGSFMAGWVGQYGSKRKALCVIYVMRAVVITVFILTPVSTASVLVFSATMGIFWLSTVPLTMGLVAVTQGLRFLSTLTGLVFLSHQTGSFIGAWLGGRLYDLNQDYTPMWWAAVALGIVAALIHLPIREQPGPLARQEAT